MALNTQIWVKQLKEGFYPETSFLNYVLDFSENVNNNKIHIASAGIDPKVIVNNTTYPIKTVGRVDDDCEITLDTFSTENTLVRLPVTIEYSYDQMESVLRQHRNTLQKSVGIKAIHAIAPDENTNDTPVIMTTGEVKGTRKAMQFADILALKERFDENEIPNEKRYLVLHPKHVSDLLAEDLNLFKDLTNIVDGVPTRFAGFHCLTFSKMPTYSILSGEAKKIAYGGEDTEHFASVAFYGDEVMKSDGEIKMYQRLDDPEQRANIVGFDKRFVCLPIRGKGIGAIVSASN